MPQEIIPGPKLNIFGGRPKEINQELHDLEPSRVLPRIRADCVSFTGFIPLLHPSDLRSKEFY